MNTKIIGLNQELVDYIAIKRILDLYMSALDRRDLEDMRLCFTDDADLHYHADLEDASKGDHRVGGQSFAGPPFDRLAKLASTNHTMSNSVIKIDGDRATADSRGFTYLLNGEAGEVSMRAVRYLDDLVRTPDGWRITRRRHIPQIQFEVRASAIRMPGRVEAEKS